MASADWRESWRETTAPVEIDGERWTHVQVTPSGQILLARLMPSGCPAKVCRLVEAPPPQRGESLGNATLHLEIDAGAFDQALKLAEQRAEDAVRRLLETLGQLNNLPPPQPEIHGGKLDEARIRAIAREEAERSIRTAAHRAARGRALA